MLLITDVALPDSPHQRIYADVAFVGFSLHDCVVLGSASPASLFALASAFYRVAALDDAIEALPVGDDVKVFIRTLPDQLQGVAVGATKKILREGPATAEAVDAAVRAFIAKSQSRERSLQEHAPSAEEEGLFGAHPGIDGWLRQQIRKAKASDDRGAYSWLFENAGAIEQWAQGRDLYSFSLGDVRSEIDVAPGLPGFLGEVTGQLSEPVRSWLIRRLYQVLEGRERAIFADPEDLNRKARTIEAWQKATRPAISRLTFEQAGDAARRWAHAEGVSGDFGGEEEPDAHTERRRGLVWTDPETGWQVHELAEQDLGAEGSALDHCVGKHDQPYCRRVRKGESRIFSLRDEGGRRLITAEMDPEATRVREWHGMSDRAPTRPEEKVFKKWIASRGAHATRMEVAREAAEPHRDTLSPAGRSRMGLLNSSIQFWSPAGSASTWQEAVRLPGYEARVAALSELPLKELREAWPFLPNKVRGMVAGEADDDALVWSFDPNNEAQLDAMMDALGNRDADEITPERLLGLIKRTEPRNLATVLREGFHDWWGWEAPFVRKALEVAQDEAPVWEALVEIDPGIVEEMAGELTVEQMEEMGGLPAEVRASTYLRHEQWDEAAEVMDEAMDDEERAGLLNSLPAGVPDDALVNFADVGQRHTDGDGDAWDAGLAIAYTIQDVGKKRSALKDFLRGATPEERYETLSEIVQEFANHPYEISGESDWIDEELVRCTSDSDFLRDAFPMYDNEENGYLLDRLTPEHLASALGEYPTEALEALENHQQNTGRGAQGIIEVLSEPDLVKVLEEVEDEDLRAYIINRASLSDDRMQALWGEAAAKRGEDGDPGARLGLVQRLPYSQALALAMGDHAASSSPEQERFSFMENLEPSVRDWEGDDDVLLELASKSPVAHLPFYIEEGAGLSALDSPALQVPGVAQWVAAHVDALPDSEHKHELRKKLHEVAAAPRIHALTRDIDAGRMSQSRLATIAGDTNVPRDLRAAAAAHLNNVPLLVAIYNRARPGPATTLVRNPLVEAVQKRLAQHGADLEWENEGGGARGNYYNGVIDRGSWKLKPLAQG